MFIPYTGQGFGQARKNPPAPLVLRHWQLAAPKNLKIFVYPFKNFAGHKMAPKFISQNPTTKIMTSESLKTLFQGH